MSLLAKQDRAHTAAVNVCYQDLLSPINFAWPCSNSHVEESVKVVFALTEIKLMEVAM